jgi:hypothetical protein
MTNTDFLISYKRMPLAFKILCCAVAASLLFGCDPAENAGPTASTPSPDATNASPSAPPKTNEYSVGAKIDFSSAGNSKPFKVSGWSDAETQQSWTNGPVSVLALRISPTADALTLKIKCGGFTKDPDLPTQPVEVYANDEKIADWNVRELSDYTTPIPSAISNRGGLLKITLKIPKAVSPKSLGMGQDSRLLGLSCIEASLSPTK